LTKGDIKTKVCWLWSSDNHLLSSLLWVSLALMLSCLSPLWQYKEWTACITNRINKKGEDQLQNDSESSTSLMTTIW